MTRRIIAVLSVMALMAAMLVVTAAPAFADCDQGQSRATFNAFQRGDADLGFKHDDKWLDCATGSEPPGEGHDK